MRLGWTQHSHSVQLIHTAAMLQLLLGNIGMPGGGINAQRGTLEHPGRDRHGRVEHAPGLPESCRAPTWTSLAEYNARRLAPTPLRAGLVELLEQHAPSSSCSLLKAYYGERATSRTTSFGYDFLPKIGETARQLRVGVLLRSHERRRDRRPDLVRDEPGANGPNSIKMLSALSQAEVDDRRRELRDRDGRVLEGEGARRRVLPGGARSRPTSRPRCSCCLHRASRKKTAPSSTRRGGCSGSTRRSTPPGDAMPMTTRLSRACSLKIARTLPRKKAVTAPEPLTGDGMGATESGFAVDLDRGRQGDQRDRSVASGRSKYRASERSKTTARRAAATGSTRARTPKSRKPNGPAQGQEDPTGLGLYASWMLGAWPANRRVLYNRASADAERDSRGIDDPCSDSAGSDGRYDRRRARLQSRRTPPDTQRLVHHAAPRASPSCSRPTFAEGPFPEHYEPAESPVENAHAPVRRSSNPAATIFYRPRRRSSSEAAEDYPYVALTYRLTEHFHYWTKHVESTLRCCQSRLLRRGARSARGGKGHRQRRIECGSARLAARRKARRW